MRTKDRTSILIANMNAAVIGDWSDRVLKEASYILDNPETSSPAHINMIHNRLKLVRTDGNSEYLKELVAEAIHYIEQIDKVEP
jgi:ABC-type sulfate transport system substrate-binding protein